MFTQQDGKVLLKTKARNVTIVSESGHPGKQQLLKDMFQSPELVEQIYLSGQDIRVVFNNQRPLTVGIILPKYMPEINGHDTIVREWKVTGGYPLKQPTEENQSIQLANFGLNLEIQVL